MKKFLQEATKVRSPKKGCPCKGAQSKGELRTILRTEAHNLMNTLHKGMSRGAEDISRMISSRGKWGSKNLWGFKEKGRGKKSH